MCSYISDCEVQGHCFSKSINTNPIVLSTIKYSFEICPEGFMVQFSKVDSNADLTATVSNFPISLKIRFKFKCHFFYMFNTRNLFNFLLQSGLTSSLIYVLVLVSVASVCVIDFPFIRGCSYKTYYN